MLCIRCELIFMSPKSKSLVACVSAIGLSLGAGAVGSLFTVSAIPTWYAALNKPVLSPPNWIFGPVWTMLYVLMGVAAFLIWQKGSAKKEVRLALLIFVLQLVLNALWSIIFFGWHKPGLAFLEIVLLWASILWTIGLFHKVSRTAALLLVPYLLWVSFASYLNYAIWSLN